MGRNIVCFIAGALLITACGSVASFPYRYYILKPENYSGKLIGDKPENDLNLTLCSPEQGKQAKCLVMFKDSFIKMKTEYLSIQKELKDCQRGL